MSVEEQISLIAGADEIAATVGTLTHWVIFCKPTAKLIILNRTKYSLPAQAFVQEVVGFDNYFVVEAFKNFLYAKKHNSLIYFLGANKYWKKFVADYFGEQIDEDDDYEYLDAALEDYIDFWCKRYSDPKNFDKWVVSFKDLCNQVVALKSELIQRKKNRPLINYQTHVDRNGWIDWEIENQISNPLDEKHDIQAIKINFPEHKIFYAVYFNDKEGWSAEVSDGEQAGTTGKSKAIYGVKIRLDEAGAKEFDIFYRVHKFDGTWTAWGKNGAEIYSDGQKLNAIQIRLKNKI